jgi:hypothetical protein
MGILMSSKTMISESRLVFCANAISQLAILAFCDKSIWTTLVIIMREAIIL